MVGLIILTHGQMAAECLLSAEMIVGPISNCRTISIDRSCSVEEATNRLALAIKEVDTDAAGVLILTDMFGGTPTNIAAEFLSEGRVDILSGVNLPMLIKAASIRHSKGLDELASFLCDYGQRAIIRPVDLLNARKK